MCRVGRGCANFGETAQTDPARLIFLILSNKLPQPQPHQIHFFDHENTKPRKVERSFMVGLRFARPHAS